MAEGEGLEVLANLRGCNSWSWVRSNGTRKSSSSAVGRGAMPRAIGPRRLRISDGSVGTLTFAQAIVATGSRPLQLPGVEIDGERVMTSREALRLRDIPERLLVVGG